jgi:acetyl esterase/lipase
VHLKKWEYRGGAQTIHCTGKMRYPVSMKITRILSLCSLFLAAGCAQAKFFVVNAPTWFDGVEVRRDIAYGAVPLQKLDIYIPPGLGTDEKRDVIVFFYGGRWMHGDKADYRFAGTALAKKGFIVVVPDYRKYPAVRFPVFVEDGAKAVAWAADHIGEYGGDAGSIHLAGHSAGAHIGALLASDSRYMRAEGKSRDIIRSFSGLAGPYAFTPDKPDLKDIFAPPENYPSMQVTTFIDGHQPPMLLLYGDKDEDVKRYNLDRLEKSIHEKGGCVRTKIYPGADHVDIVAALSWIGADNFPVTEDIAVFIKKGCKG